MTASVRRRRLASIAVFAGLMLVPHSLFPVAVLGVLATTALVRTLGAARRGGSDASAVETAGVRLGSSTGGATAVLPEAALAAHGLILGASGAGKTTSLRRILEDRIARGAPVIVIDLKGSPALATALADAAGRAGRPFAMWSPDGPGHWNPLATGNPTELKDKLIGGERYSEPHYQKVAERYLQLALTVACAAHPDWPPTLAETVALTDPRRLATALRAVPADLRAEVQDYLVSLTPDAHSGIQGVGTRLAILTESHTGAFLAPGPGPTVDVRAALRGEAVTLFSLNASRYGALAAQLGTMAVQDLVAAAGARLSADGERPPALVAIDEFSALGAAQVVRLFAQAREAGVGVVVATQELADLDRVASGLRDQILGNTAFKLVHRQDVPGSARNVSAMAGIERVWEETHQFGGGLASRLLPHGSRREVERPRVHPDEVMGLRVGEAVLITKVPHMRVATVRVDPAARAGTPVAPAGTTAGGGARARSPCPTPVTRRPPRAGRARPAVRPGGERGTRRDRGPERDGLDR